nr:alpha/beta hydrolase [Kitasatospora sp. MBT63]
MAVADARAAARPPGPAPRRGGPARRPARRRPRPGQPAGPGAAVGRPQGGEPARLGPDVRAVRRAAERPAGAEGASRPPRRRPVGARLFLLGLEPAGDGRAIVALGDPDTAQHTAVLVPGTGTTLARMPGQLERIGRLQQAACAVAPGRSVSVISWLGYDAPEIPPESLGVAGRGRAEDGAEAMRRFTRGTRVAQGGNRSHLTVIGHSYGTTAVGAAAAGGEGLDADDLVAIASPGMTTAHASDLHAAPGHVWVGAAGNDPIRLAAGRTLGADPMAAPFGGTVIATDTSGHSGYWDPDSQSLLNQGRIIAGKQPATVAG